MAVAIYLRPGWSLDGLQKSWCHLHLLTLMMSILDGWPPTCLCAYMVYMFVWFSHGSFSNTITGWCFGLLFTFYVFNKPNPIRNDHPQIKSVPRVAEIYCSLPEPRWYLARWFSVHESASRYLSDDDIKVFTECCDPCLYWHYQPLLLVFSQFRYHIYICLFYQKQISVRKTRTTTGWKHECVPEAGACGRASRWTALAISAKAPCNFNLNFTFFEFWIPPTEEFNVG